MADYKCPTCDGPTEKAYTVCSACKEHRTPVQKVLEKNIIGITNQYHETVKKTTERALVIQRLLDAGIKILRPYDLNIYSEIVIERSQLSQIYKLLGTLKLVYRDIPSDFEQTKELFVIVKTVKNEIFFKYRVPYKNNGKCKIVENTVPSYTSKQLVCGR